MRASGRSAGSTITGRGSCSRARVSVQTFGPIRPRRRSVLSAVNFGAPRPSEGHQPKIRLRAAATLAPPGADALHRARAAGRSQPRKEAMQFGADANETSLRLCMQFACSNSRSNFSRPRGTSCAPATLSLCSLWSQQHGRVRPRPPAHAPPKRARALAGWTLGALGWAHAGPLRPNAPHMHARRCRPSSRSKAPALCACPSARGTRRAPAPCFGC